MEGLKLQEKLYDFWLYIYPQLNNFPKYEKLHLRTRIEDCVLDIMDSVERANKSYAKKAHAYEADILLAKLRRLVRAANDLRFISLHRYSVISGKLAEIGAILGGWIKWMQTQDELSKKKAKTKST
jgi:hypothetical protein